MGWRVCIWKFNVIENNPWWGENRESQDREEAAPGTSGWLSVLCEMGEQRLLHSACFNGQSRCSDDILGIVYAGMNSDLGLIQGIGDCVQPGGVGRWYGNIRAVIKTAPQYRAYVYGLCNGPGRIIQCVLRTRPEASEPWANFVPNSRYRIYSQECA